MSTDSSVFSNGTEVEERSFKVVASMLKKNEYGEFEKVMSFRPSGRAVDKADALLGAWNEIREGQDFPLIEADLEHLLCEMNIDGLYLYIALVLSASRCQTCGALKENPTDWCYDPGDDDKGGCAKFRTNPTKVKGPSSSELEQRRRLEAMLKQNGK